MKNILTLLSFLFLQQVYATTDTLLLDHERHIWIKAVILKADTFIDKTELSNEKVKVLINHETDTVKIRHTTLEANTKDFKGLLFHYISREKINEDQYVLSGNEIKIVNSFLVAERNLPNYLGIIFNGIFILLFLLISSVEGYQAGAKNEGLENPFIRPAYFLWYFAIAFFAIGFPLLGGKELSPTLIGSLPLLIFIWIGTYFLHKLFWMVGSKKYMKKIYAT